MKLPAYTAETTMLDVDTLSAGMGDPLSPWLGRLLHDLCDEVRTPWDWRAPAFARATALVRPGTGLPPECYYVSIGRRAQSDVLRGTPAPRGLLGTSQESGDAL